MIRKSLVDAFDLSCPVLSAGMPFAGCPPLVAAVSNAGGMGFLGAETASASEVAEMIRATRRLTSRPFGVSFATPFVTQEHVETCVGERPAVVAFSRDQPHRLWTRAIQGAGIAVWRHVASPTEGRVAVKQGADAVIVDGGESSSTPPYWPLITLLPATVEAVFPRPAIAAGGIDDGRRLAAALVLGADAVWCGARFLASREVEQLRHKTPRVYGFRPVPHRGSSSHLNLTAATPSADLLEGMLTGRSRTVRPRACPEIKPAAEIVRELTQEATAVLQELYSTLRPCSLHRERTSH